MSEAAWLKTCIKSIVSPVRSAIRLNRSGAKIEERKCLSELPESAEFDIADFTYKTNLQAKSGNPLKIFINRIIDTLNPRVNLINFSKYKLEVVPNHFSLPRDPSETTLTALLQCKNFTYDTPNLKLMKDFYGNDDIYDLGLRFAIVANNTFIEKGQAYYIKRVPEMFYGIEHKELCQKLDLLNLYLKPNKINKFSIGGKDYAAKFIGGGANNDVYLIEDKLGNKVCFRQAREPYSLSGYGHDIYSEVAINLEAQKAGVKDIAKLYMANPVGSYVKVPSGSNLERKTKGAWQIVEYVDKSRINPQGGITLNQWLESKGLVHSDVCINEFNDAESNIIGSTIVDLGGIMNDGKNITQWHGFGSWILKEYQNGSDSKEILKKYIY